jgi:hypothetical protein
LVERFEEKAALQHPIFKPVDLPEFQIGDDRFVTVFRTLDKNGEPRHYAQYDPRKKSG